ncbi:MAG: uroporphyrinogen-III C-methyltransferase [Rhodoferax sp.]
MNAETALPASEERAPTPVAPTLPWRHDRWVQVLGAVAALALIACIALWQKLSGIQQQLARQSAESGANAAQALVASRQAQEQAMETAAKLAVTDAKVNEVSLQRAQLEELMSSLSRSRDENLVVDIESAVRLAQQQAQLTGSVEPLLAALRTAELRLTRAAQPRLAPLQRAIGRDLARVKSSVVADLPALLVRLDELVALVDELPVANAVGSTRGASAATLKRKPEEALGEWWKRALAAVHEEARALVRISRIEEPDAALLSPEQAFFLHENLKLRILNARLGLVSRQLDAARSDMASAAVSLSRYFDASSRKTQTAAALMQQIQSQMKQLELPRVDDTLVALSTAAAGR